MAGKVLKQSAADTDFIFGTGEFDNYRLHHFIPAAALSVRPAFAPAPASLCWPDLSPGASIQWPSKLVDRHREEPDRHLRHPGDRKNFVLDHPLKDVLIVLKLLLREIDISLLNVRLEIG